MRRHAAAGGEEGDALLRRFRFAQADRFIRRKHLAVAVGEGDKVPVHKVERADARTRQCLGAVAAHAAQPEHRHAGCGERLHRLLPEESARAGESLPVVFVVKIVHI